MTPAPWKWEVSKGSRKLLGADGSSVLEARVSRFKPPTIFVQPDDAKVIEASADMLATLVDIEISLRLSGMLPLTTDRIQDLLNRIQA